jgi:pimeloyl-ACP methyl ester carboxylesterase
MWIVGHSDGGSIALLYASAFPDALAGAAVLAPHTFVEAMTVDAISQTKVAYESTDLRARLARYHDDVDSAFYGWNDVWLDPAFRHWDIAAELASIRRPLLAIQGHDDEYSTMEQIDRIKAHVPHIQLAKLPDCGHSPHRDAASAVNDAIADFFNAHQASNWLQR